MNCRGIFLLFFFIFLQQLSAQDPTTSAPSELQPTNRVIKYKKLQLGIVGDLNTVKLVSHSANVKQSYGTEFGGGGGIHFQYNLKRQLAFTLNCLYEQKNWKSIPYSFHGRNINENRIHTITLPLMVKYSPFKRNFFMMAGPYLGIVLKKEVKGFEVGNYVYKSPFEAGAAFGLGFNIPLSNSISILIEGRDYVNLSTSKSLAELSKMYTPAVQMGVFYKFGKTEQVEVKKKATDSVWKKQKKVFLKVYYAPQCSYRTRSEDEVRFGKGDNYEYGGYFSTSFTYDKSKEVSTFNWGAGLEMQFLLSKHLDLCLGFGFDREGFKTQPQDLVVTYVSAGHYVWEDTTIQTALPKQSLQFSYDFITRPIRLNYYFLKGKITYYAGLGFIRATLAGHKFKFSETSDYDFLMKNSELTKDKKRWKYFEAAALFYSVNVGISKPLSKSLFIFFEPEFKMEIGRMPKSPGLWSTGCKAGLKF